MWMVNVTVTVLVCLIGFLSVQHSRFCFFTLRSNFYFCCRILQCSTPDWMRVGPAKSPNSRGWNFLSASPGFSKDLRTCLFQLETQLQPPNFPTPTLSASLSICVCATNKGVAWELETEANAARLARAFCFVDILLWKREDEEVERAGSSAKRTRATNATSKGTSFQRFLKWTNAYWKFSNYNYTHFNKWNRKIYNIWYN